MHVRFKFVRYIGGYTKLTSGLLRFTHGSIVLEKLDDNSSQLHEAMVTE